MFKLLNFQAGMIFFQYNSQPTHANLISKPTLCSTTELDTWKQELVVTREAQEEMEKLGQRTWQLTQKATGVFSFRGDFGIFFFREGVKNLGLCAKKLPLCDILLLSIVMINNLTIIVIVMIIVRYYNCCYYSHHYYGCYHYVYDY